MTAEAAFGIGILILVAFGLAWMVSLGVTGIRAQDAAREAVRALARGDDSASAVALAEQVAPTGSTVTTEMSDGLARVIVRSPIAGPGGLFGFIGHLVITGQAVGAIEGVPGG